MRSGKAYDKSPKKKFWILYNYVSSRNVEQYRSIFNKPDTVSYNIYSKILPLDLSLILINQLYGTKLLINNKD